MSIINQKVIFNINERIKFTAIMKKYLLSIKEKNNCLILYNIDEKTNKPKYKIGDNIIIDKRIGTPSRYGIVYLAHLNINNENRLNKFAIKIIPQLIENKDELLMLEKLTKFVIDLKCPHFPISYGYLKCNNSYLNKDIKNYFPELINKHHAFYLEINELADGDLFNLMLKENIDIFNNITQILISIMFFHYYSKHYHTDTHQGNFLYHKIKPGGYFYYNIYGKDYYLENQGYLWVIWDFGLILPLTDGEYNKLSINYDYNYLFNKLEKLNFLENHNIFTMAENTIRILLHKKIIKKYNKIYDIRLLKKIDKEILEFLLKNVSSFTTIKPSKIINKKPYIIR